MIFNQSAFNQFIIQNNVIKHFDTPITLKSGALSHTYVNWRSVAEDAYLMNQLTDFVLAYAKFIELSVDTFYGVAEGATKLGILTQFKHAQNSSFKPKSHTLAMGRAKPKPHGDPGDRFFVGSPTGKVCVLEDVTTTGGSLINCIRQLKEHNMSIVAAIGLTNRNEFRNDKKSVKEALASEGVVYYEMSCANKLLDILEKK
ncbi:MAG: hypothetical protein ACO3K7_04365 [Candidatus Marinamargulisbacteria bacterium]